MKAPLFILFISTILPVMVAGQLGEFPGGALPDFDPAQKPQIIYLHTDKDNYFAGDNLWFKAYVLSGQDHIPDTLETTLYVDIMNVNSGALVKREVIKIQGGIGAGDFQLGDSLPQGNYVLRAYSLYSLQLDESAVYRMNFYVQNPEYENYIRRRQRRENRRFNRELERKQSAVRFEVFPEGGTITAGILNRVGFRAANELGEGLYITGRLMTGAGVEVTEIASQFDGRGDFYFTPEPEKAYYIVYELENGDSGRFSLDNISTAGIGIMLKQEQDIFSFTIDGNFTEADALRDTISLLVHSRNGMHNWKRIAANEMPVESKITVVDLPSGIVVATLFNGSAELVGERIFLNQPDSRQQPDFDITSGESTLQLSINPGKTVTNPDLYSLSITAWNERRPASGSHILSSVFLYPDLKQHPARPHIVFAEKDNMDLFMLTTHWQRKSVDLIGEFHPGEMTEREEGFPVYGRVEPTEQSSELGMSTFELTMTLEEDERLRTAVTDADGYFSFRPLQISGEFGAEITILGLKGSIPGYIDLLYDRLPEEKLTFNPFLRELPQRRGDKWKRVNIPRYRSSDRRKELKNTLPYHYGTPDQVIYLKENDTRYSNMRDVLVRGTAGILVDGNAIIIRGQSSIMFSSQAMIQVDGHIVPASHFLHMTPMEISHVEIYKGTSTSIFGVKGANGVIVGHSRRGNVQKRHMLQYILSGYYIPRDFVHQPRDMDLFGQFPEYQVTLNWDPFARTKNGHFFAEFPAVEQASYYRIILEGADEKGQITREEKWIPASELK